MDGKLKRQLELQAYKMRKLALPVSYTHLDVYKRQVHGRG